MKVLAKPNLHRELLASMNVENDHYHQQANFSAWEALLVASEIVKEENDKSLKRQYVSDEGDESDEIDEDTKGSKRRTKEPEPSNNPSKKSAKMKRER